MLSKNETVRRDLHIMLDVLTEAFFMGYNLLILPLSQMSFATLLSITVPALFASVR